jgi:hypothetical protein
LANEHPEETLRVLKEHLAQPYQFDTNALLYGLGYIHSPTIRSFLADYLQSTPTSNSTYGTALDALARQEQPGGSFDTVSQILSSKPLLRNANAVPDLMNALSDTGDGRAGDTVRSLALVSDERARRLFVRALVKLNDPWAVGESVKILSGGPSGQILHKGEYDTYSLTFVETPTVTEAFKKYLVSTWPTKIDKFSVKVQLPDLENYAGAGRRSSVLGELARRDPHWLAEFALEQMASDSPLARAAGFQVFQQLTGHAFAYDPMAFAAERAQALAKVAAWWKEHGNESREAWLRAYFHEHGFDLEHVWEPSSLPVLAAALASDPLTHSLALEQISVITGKYFSTFKFAAAEQAIQDQERENIRVLGWLRAHHLIPEEIPASNPPVETPSVAQPLPPDQSSKA